MSEGLKAVREALMKTGIPGVEASEWRNSVMLTGKVNTWDDKIQTGYAAVHKGYKGVVNDVEVDGIESDVLSLPVLRDHALEGKHFDVVVIGGGVIGTSIVRELSRFNIKIALLEKDEDLAKHASSRNDGMIHPGIAPSPKSRKAYYNIRGNRAYTKICEELKVRFKRPGSILLYRSAFSKLVTPFLIARAKQNGIDRYEYINRESVEELEPYVTKEQHGGFLLPSTGILSPYQLTIAYAENAIENNVQLILNTAVTGFKMDNNHIAVIKTNRGNLNACVVVNAGGVWADKIAGYANDRFFSIHPRKGMDAILDIKTVKYQTRIMAMPSLLQIKSKTKGGGVVPTIEGNLLIGPTAEEVPCREDYSTDQKTMDILFKYLKLNIMLKKSDIITYFSGIRSCTYEEDFIVEPSEYVDNLVHAAGIQSPGLASAPAIAVDICKFCIKILRSKKEVRPKNNFNPFRKIRPELTCLSLEERAKIIKKNPSYGRIVCRCESISEQEVIDGLCSSIPVKTLDGIKRRTRVGMGRCHGGFCTPRVMEIMSEKLKLKMTEIKKKGDHSEIVLNETKGKIDYSNKIVKTMKTEE